MAIRLWPQDYERKDHITKAEKGILRYAARNFQNGHMVVGIDPVGLSGERVKLGMYISPSEGLVTFSIYSGMINAMPVFSYIAYVQMVEGKIYERLLDSKLLIVRNGEKKALKFPYKHIVMFPDEVVGKTTVSKDDLQQLRNYATFDSFRPITSDGKEKRIEDLKIFAGIRKAYDKTFKSLSELECRAIFERLAPEYTVVLNETINVCVAEKKTLVTEADLRITGKELEYKTFFLDEYQVGVVNDMGKGHRVILANPGAGKSVLLLSKAFKYASLYKGSNVLLTCYNSNLADSYNFKRSCANFGKDIKLFIMTFHKLVKKIYEECLHSHCASNIATEEEIQKCIDMVKQGKVKLRFKAIFIDEVQIFDPLYLELCYRLLEDDDDRVFLMAGDLNQAVRALSRKGDAPWKRMNGIQLDFTGRVRYIEKNYRNSQEIGEYISHKMLFGQVKKKCPVHGFTGNAKCSCASCGGHVLQNVGLLKDPIPTLFIQDEMHLVKESLGTFDAHYESFLSYYAKELVPEAQRKLIRFVGATATISMYESHIWHLYHMDGRRFPCEYPSAEAGEDFYSYTDNNDITRILIGHAPYGRSITDGMWESVYIMRLVVYRMIQFLEESYEKLCAVGFSGSIDEYRDIPKRYRSAYIIDGQHRLYGYSDSLYAETNTIPVVAFVDLERSEQIKLFMDINENQKAVPKSLRVTLNADMLWESPDFSEQRQALRSKIAQMLGEESTSPLNSRIVIGENESTPTRCITVEAIQSALKKCRFFDSYGKKNVLQKEGTFDCKDNQETCDLFYPFIEKCLLYIRGTCLDEWDKGDQDSGMLTMNRGIQAVIRVIDDVVNMLVEKGMIQPKTQALDDMFGLIQYYLKPLTDYINNLNAEQRKDLRGYFGGGADTRFWRAYQKAIADMRPDFVPDGLEEFWQNEAKIYNEETKSMLREIESKVKLLISERLGEYFGDSWLIKGLPKNIYTRAKGEADEAMYVHVSSTGEEIDIPIWDYVTLPECKQIILNGKNWSLFFEDTFVRPEEANLVGGKDPKTDWILRVNSISNKLSKESYSVPVDEYSYVKSIYDWLMGILVF